MPVCCFSCEFEQVDTHGLIYASLICDIRLAETFWLMYPQVPRALQAEVVSHMKMLRPNYSLRQFTSRAYPTALVFKLCWGLLTCCHAREVVVCNTGETYAYAAQSSLFDFEEHKLRVAWFQSASLTPLPDSGAILSLNYVD